MDGPQVPLFTTATVEGERQVTGLEPVFQGRLNPGNSLLVVIKAGSFRLLPFSALRLSRLFRLLPLPQRAMLAFRSLAPPRLGRAMCWHVSPSQITTE